LHRNSFAKKLQNQTVIRGKLDKELLNKKVSNKMLMKWHLIVDIDASDLEQDGSDPTEVVGEGNDEHDANG